MKYNLDKYNNNILDSHSTVSDAKAMLKKNLLDNIVLVEDGKYLGTIFKTDLYNINKNQKFEGLKDIIKPLYLREDYTLFDYLKIASTHRLKRFPLVDENMFLAGMVNFKDILKKFEKTGLNVDNSTVLVVKKSSEAFSYSEVFQIAEANAAKIFGSYINSSDKEETEIVLNIYHMGLNELLQSYRRYDYDIVSYHEEDLHHETLKANSEYFSKYLTV